MNLVGSSCGYGGYGGYGGLGPLGAAQKLGSHPNTLLTSGNKAARCNVISQVATKSMYLFEAT